MKGFYEGKKSLLRKMKQCGLAAAVAGAVLASPFQSLAKEEEDRTPIEEVRLEVSSSIQVGDIGSDVDVTVNAGDCEVTTVDVVNEPNEKWAHKDKPKVEVTLEADRDSYFKSGFSKKKVKLENSSGTISSVKRKNSEEIKVVITLKALKGTDSDYELEVDEAEWDQMNGVGEWNDSEDAKHYELRLYRDGKLITNIRPVKEASYDFGSYLNKAGSYTFEVRAVYSSSRKGDWQESDSFDITEAKAAEIAADTAYKAGVSGPAAGTWENDSLGFRYRNSDQTYTISNWQQIDGSWYFFDENGYRKTGWALLNAKWYYFDENGAMLANTVTPDGRQVGADGALIS